MLIIRNKDSINSKANPNSLAATMTKLAAIPTLSLLENSDDSSIVRRWA